MMIMTIFNDQFCFAQKLPKNAKMWKCKILDTFSMTFWLRTKFLGPAKIQNWTSGSVLEIPNSWLLVVEGAAELCRLILLISDHPIQQGYYKFWNQVFSGTPCIGESLSVPIGALTEDLWFQNTSAPCSSDVRAKYCIEHSFVFNFFWGQLNGGHPPLVLVNILSWLAH